MTHQKWGGKEEHARGAAECVFGVLLIEIFSRKAVPEVTSTFPGPLHYFVIIKW